MFQADRPQRKHAILSTSLLSSVPDSVVPSDRRKKRRKGVVKGSMRHFLSDKFYHCLIFRPVTGEEFLLARTLLAVCITALMACVSFADAQTPQQPPAQSANTGATATIPGFWDPRHRPERPDLTRITLIRFLTETDYPPFDYTGPDGNPAGFNVDLARAICEELKVTCTIQQRRFDTLLDALARNQGDAIIASIAPTADTRARADFSDPYYRVPARFVARRNTVPASVRPERLEGKKVGVVAGSAHEAYLKSLFTEAELVPYPNIAAQREALQRGDVDLIFGDGISLAFWLNGTDSAACCVFAGGPFIESRYFGEGIGIAVKRGNNTLRQAFNWALFRIWEKGRFTDLWLRYFPINPF